MKISGLRNNTYLYVNGLSVSRTICLSDNVMLLPAKCGPVPDDIIKQADSEIDIGIICIFLRQVRSQLRITAPDAKTLAVLAWNSVWDIALLSALFNCEAVINLQCDKPTEKFDSKTKLEITNYHLRGLVDSPRIIEESEAIWVEDHFKQAQTLLSIDAFQNAVHCLSSYHWHPHPRARLALLWSGIEGLFKIESELVFRISLYASKFISPDNRDQAKEHFYNVKKLYKQRSAAVHGAKIKGDSNQAVANSAALLQTLIRQCIVTESLPTGDELVL